MERSTGVHRRFVSAALTPSGWSVRTRLLLADWMAGLHRYLGRKYNLLGSGEQEMVAVDMVMEGVESLRVKYVNLIYVDKLVRRWYAGEAATGGQGVGVVGMHGWVRGWGSGACLQGGWGRVLMRPGLGRGKGAGDGEVAVTCHEECTGHTASFYYAGQGQGLQTARPPGHAAWSSHQGVNSQVSRGAMAHAYAAPGSSPPLCSSIRLSVS